MRFIRVCLYKGEDGYMNVLAIGNGFSQDATRYLHGIAAHDGCDMTVVNLNAHNSSLSEHYKNRLSDAKAYMLEFNGFSTGFKVSIKEALLSRDWDVVCIQQFSEQSVNYETFQPYISDLAKYIKKYAPNTELAIHQTWAYEQNSKYLLSLGYDDKFRMSMDVKKCYERAANEIGADKIIPSADLFLRMSAQGVRMFRDGLNASLGPGRYALGLLWYATLTGRRIVDNTYSKFDEQVSATSIDIAKRCVETLSSF